MQESNVIIGEIYATTIHGKIMPIRITRKPGYIINTVGPKNRQVRGDGGGYEGINVMTGREEYCSDAKVLCLWKDYVRPDLLLEHAIGIEGKYE